MTTESSRDESRPASGSKPPMPPTPRHRKVALAFSVGIVCAFVGIAWVGLIPLPRSDGFVPAVQATIAVTDFITAVLLFARYASERSRALWILACGYLFTAFIVVAHTLTFPGAITATGLLGATAQTAAWLYVVWHVALPAAAIGYALLKDRPSPTANIHTTPAIAIRHGVVASVAAACVITWAVIAASDALPTLIVSEREFAGMATVVTVIPMLLSALSFGLLWRRRTSVVDEWLLVALVASLAETALVVYLGASRYTFPFYATRPLGIVAASAVLVALMSEMAMLHVRLSSAVRALQRERANKLMNLDVVVSSIGHEIKQPLMVITTCSAVIENLLRKPKVDVDEVKLNVDDVKNASVRIAETIDSLRGLFRESQEAYQPIDMNALVVESLKGFDAELSGHDIAVTTELAAGLPRVVGHRGQLREVLVNIVQNAIDALALTNDRTRALRVRTSYTKANRISVSIEDSGEGIALDRLPTLFTAFITTRMHGMGLGLSLCQMIVDRHNGELSVESEVGKGTRFEVSLPAEPPESAAVVQEARAQSRSLKSIP
jgi:signal transduction histidine kinase